MLYTCMASKARLTLFECFCSQSLSFSQHSSSGVESRDHLDHSRSIRSCSRSSSPQPSDGRQSEHSTADDHQLNQPLHENVCDKICLGCPVSISSDSQVSEDHEEDPGQCDELLYTSSSSADVCDCRKLCNTSQ